MSIAFVALSVIFLSLVWNNNVWMDEAFTASLVHDSFIGVIKASMADTLPPLYNIILWATTSVFGYTVPVMKITSVLPMILTLLLGATVVRRRFGVRTALLFMIYITLMPLFMYYGVEIRMYSLGYFAATGAGLYAYEIVCENTRSNWIKFTLFSVLAGYSHHFAFVTAAFAYLYLLIYFIFIKKSGIKDWLKCLLATFILYLPCLIVTINQIQRVSTYFSMPYVDVALFIQYLSYPFVVGIRPASILCVMMMWTALVIFSQDVFWDGDRNPDKIYAICCFTVYYGVLVFGTVMGKILPANIFVDRYLFFSAGLLWLFAAIIFDRSDKTYYIAVIAALIVGVCTYIVEFKVEYSNSANEEIAYLRTVIEEGDTYYSISEDEDMQNCIPFYTILDDETPDLEYIDNIEDAIKTAKKRGTDTWVTVIDGHEIPQEDLAVLIKNNKSLEKEADFDFDRYKCTFYKVVDLKS